MTEPEIKSPMQAHSDRLMEWDKENLRSILKEKWGCGFIWRLLEKCNVFSQSFVPGSSDLTAFNEGRRSIGNALLIQVMDINPDAYLEMTKIAKKEARNARSAAELESKLRSED